MVSSILIRILSKTLKNMYSMIKKTLFLNCFTFMLFSGTFAQVSVDVNLNVKHIVGGKSEFDRNKYITLHSSLVDSEWPSLAEQEDFLINYDVFLDLEHHFNSILKTSKTVLGYWRLSWLLRFSKYCRSLKY